MSCSRHYRYDTKREAILTCARKPSWVSLIYRTEPTTKKCKNRKKTKSRKQICSEVTVNSPGNPRYRLRGGETIRRFGRPAGQLSLASLRGRLIEYQLCWGKGRNVTSVGWHVTLCDPIWHVSSRSGVATLRTAIHLLLTYLLRLSVLYLY